MYPEYDPNEPTLGQSFADMLRGLKNPQNLQQVGQGIVNTAQIIPNVVESLGRGGVAQAVGTMGDLRDIRNTVQSYLPQSVQNFSNAAEFMTNPYAKALTQTAPTTEQTLDFVPRATAPYEGYKQHETLGEYIAPSLGYFAGKGAKQAIDTFGPKAAEMSENYLRSIGGIADIVEPSKVAQALRQPEKNALGFYSPLDEAVMNLQNQKGTGQQYLAQLLKTQGVKQEEVATRGLDTFLTENPKVTKTEIQDFLTENPIDLRETILGAKPKINTNSPYALPEVMKVLQNNTTPESMKISLQNDYDAYRALQQKNPELFNENAEDYFDVVFKDLVPNADEYKPSKFGDLQVGSGGENYREVQIRLPSGEDRPYVYATNSEKILGKVEPQDNGYYKVNFDDGTFSGGYSKESAEAIAKVGKFGDGRGTILKKFPTYQQAFDYAQSRPQEERLANHIRPAKSQPEFVNKSHYDEPNILVHMRVNDRTIDGKKTLFVEEIQSDWHQAGRKKGYQGTADKDYTNYIKDLTNRYQDEIYKYSVSEGMAEDKAKVLAKKLTDQKAQDPRMLADYFGESEKQQAMNMARVDERNLVPDAPFKNTEQWAGLAMKRAMQMAAEGGYDRIAFTTGKQQADRYNLSKQIESVEYKPSQNSQDGKFYVAAIDKQGNSHLGDWYTPEEIEANLGKEISKKIVNGDGNRISGTPEDSTMKELSGLDLQVGGEGMQDFYDKILPNYVNKYGKKNGIKVGKTKMRTSTDKQAAEDAKLLNDLGVSKGGPNAYEDVHYFDLTPEAKESFLKKGQPMFAVAPAMAITDEDSRREVLEKLFNSKK